MNGITKQLNGITEHMDTLAILLSSRVKAEVCRLLFGLNNEPLHLRELTRRSGLALGTVRQELKKFEMLDLVSNKISGNRTYYCANRTHPLYPEIHRLVLKTRGLVDVLKNALGAKGFEIAFVFGSMAHGEDHAKSDIDLMIIGDISLRELSRRLADITEILGREINPHIFGKSEFIKRKQKRDHFISRVLSEQRLFVKGGERELGKLG